MSKLSEKFEALVKEVKQILNDENSLDKLQSKFNEVIEKVKNDPDLKEYAEAIVNSLNNLINEDQTEAEQLRNKIEYDNTKLELQEKLEILKENQDLLNGAIETPEGWPEDQISAFKELSKTNLKEIEIIQSTLAEMEETAEAPLAGVTPEETAPEAA